MNELTSINSLIVSSGKKQGKDKKILIQNIRKAIEKETGLTFIQFLKKYDQVSRYRIGLSIFTTTNKTICKALNIPTEAGTRRKRKLEKESLLVSTPKKEVCPFTTYRAKYYTTNQALFNKVINYKINK